LAVSVDIGLVSCTIAGAGNEISTSAFVDRAGTLTYSTSVNGTVTRVVSVIVADAVVIEVGSAIAITNSGGIEGADAVVLGVANAVKVDIGSTVTIALAFGYARTPTVVDSSGTVTNSALVR
jgi:hypothetical protein